MITKASIYRQSLTLPYIYSGIWPEEVVRFLEVVVGRSTLTRWIEGDSRYTMEAIANSLLTRIAEAYGYLGDLEAVVSPLVIDGVTYSSVVIGDQEWMTENLRTTKYNDGTSIPVVEDDAEWIDDTIGAMCWPLHTTDEGVRASKGALYNGYAAATGKLAPLTGGWRVPSRDDWTALENYLISNGYNWDGSLGDNKYARAICGQSEWSQFEHPAYTTPVPEGSPGHDYSVNNATGMNMLPVYARSLASFTSKTTSFIPPLPLNNWFNARFWSSTFSGVVDTLGFPQAYYRQLGYNKVNFAEFPVRVMNGMSVRLVRDAATSRAELVAVLSALTKSIESNSALCNEIISDSRLL